MAVYVLRTVETIQYHSTFNWPVGERHEYDCAAVFDLQKGAFFLATRRQLHYWRQTIGVYTRVKSCAANLHSWRYRSDKEVVAGLRPLQGDAIDGNVE